MELLLRPLLLTGGPAVGKSVTARTLSERTSRCARIDVDDIRQLVKNGGVAPWHGREGIAQQVLGVRNTAAMAGNFVHDGFNVTISDVVDPRTLEVYRDLIPGVFVIKLTIDMVAAWARARTRRTYITDEEFEMLHRRQSEVLDTDLQVDATNLSVEEQVEAVRQAWTSAP